MDAESVECLDALVKEIQQEITGACMIPITLPKKEIIRIIERAKPWFYKNYENAVEFQYIGFTRDQFIGPNFKTTRAIKLPEGVISVDGVFQVNRWGGEDGGWGNYSLNNMDKDFAVQKFIYNNAYGSGMSSENIMYYVINAYFIDVARSVLQSMHGFMYNYLTRNLKFTGELPVNNVIVRTLIAIPDCNLYQEEIFKRYVIATVKMQLGRILGTFNYNLPGNITINYSELKEEGKEELENIKNEIKEEDGVDFFYTV